jgi:hypothetical protein
MYFYRSRIEFTPFNRVGEVPAQLPARSKEYRTAEQAQFSARLQPAGRHAFH